MSVRIVVAMNLDRSEVLFKRSNARRTDVNLALIFQPDSIKTLRCAVQLSFSRRSLSRRTVSSIRNRRHGINPVSKVSIGSRNRSRTRLVVVINVTSTKALSRLFVLAADGQTDSPGRGPRANKKRNERGNSREPRRPP